MTAHLPLLTLLALLPVAAAQSFQTPVRWTVPGLSNSTVDFSFTGCTRQLDTAIHCELTVTPSIDRIGNNNPITFLTFQEDVLAVDGVGNSYTNNLVSDGGRFAGSASVRVPARIPGRLVYRLQGYPRAENTFRLLTVAGKSFENVAIRNAGVPPFRQARGLLNGKPATVYLESCVPASASTANCLASVTLSTNAGKRQGQITTYTGAALVRVDGVPRQGETIPSLTVSGASFTNVPVR
ncbi:hypothetical protein [Deinococcus aestuarii]|uniref:hypothetical protein n=1 Tax=Deinococcus aestuarii TaxID=2774531 RepID=UPI001C0CE21D|nr:hypothetical protein [Deinococcus aestuarii]